MTTAHAPGRRYVGPTRLQRMSARAKLISFIVFVVVVVATPRESLYAFAFYGCLMLGLLVIARVSPLLVLRRSLIEVPLLVFALLLPLIAQGPRVEVWGASLAVAGLWGAWGVLIKATLALLASIVLIETTEPRRIILALESLHLPHQLVSIMGFMLRYLSLIAGEAVRMRTARTARGFRPAGPRAWPVIAHGVGALFIRSHARGERVHLAMLARGYDETARL